MSRIRLCYLLLSAATVLPLLLASAPVAAESREGERAAKERAAKERAAKERTARKACLKGDYGTGVDILADLFVDTREPTYIFNQGRCFEQNRRYEDAIGRFEEYLRVPGTKLSAEDRASAEKHIAECKDKLPRERVESLAPPPPTPPPVIPTTASVPQSEPSPAAVASQSAPQPPRRRWGLLTAGIVTGAVGLGGVVTGLVLNLKANQMASDMEAKPGSFSPAKEDDQKTYKTMSEVGYAAGAACVVAGAVLIWFGARSGPAPSASVSLVPAIGPDQVAGMLTGAF